MVTFTINNVLTHVDNPHPLALAIQQYLVVKREGFYQGIDERERATTGKIVVQTKYKQISLNVYNQQSQTFPTGRLGYLAEYCDAQGIPCRIFDNRKKPKRKFDCEYVGPPADGSNGMPVRQYQLDAPDVIRKAERGILWDATGSGKTYTAARIIADFGVNTLYTVPSLELLGQGHDDLQKVLKGVDVGIIGDGVWDPRRVTIASEAMLWHHYTTKKCRDLLNSTDMLILDECHHVSFSNKHKMAKDRRGRAYDMNSWYILAINCPAYYRIGLTGTPGKKIEEKRALLECIAGRIIRHVSVRELIDLKILSDVEIHMHTIKHDRTWERYDLARKNGVLLNEDFNHYVVDLACTELRAGANVLLVTGSKQHQGPILSRIFKERGFDVPFVSGDDSRKSRRKIRESFREGKLKCLIGTVYKEGVDFPFCNVGILCDGGRDEKATCQFLGRILRRAKGKSMARLHDFFHKDKKYLERHGNARLSTFVEEEIEKIITHKGIGVQDHVG